MAPITILLEPLTPRAFAEFGTVIQNPARSGAETQGEHANQGTAVKFPDISTLENHYHLSPSRRPARPSLTLFACDPRAVRAEAHTSMLDVTVLERHPYTTQTFVPLGLAPADRRAGCYVVVVAPTLRESPEERASGASGFPTAEDVVGAIDAREGDAAPFANERGVDARQKPRHPQRLGFDDGPEPLRVRGGGRPDVARARAFAGRGDQAVTYAAGTWHAPMAVVGRRGVDFVVAQFVSGIGGEDCQELALEADRGLAVDVGSLGARLAAKI